MMCSCCNEHPRRSRWWIWFWLVLLIGNCVWNDSEWSTVPDCPLACDADVVHLKP
jgi:hypothetical protein